MICPVWRQVIDERASKQSKCGRSAKIDPAVEIKEKFTEVPKPVSGKKFHRKAEQILQY